jgi:hypothetical protein
MDPVVLAGGNNSVSLLSSADYRMSYKEAMPLAIDGVTGREKAVRFWTGVELTLLAALVALLAGFPRFLVLLPWMS